jgi:MraZ protein
MFYGVTALSLDVKGRMTIPVRYRDFLSQDFQSNQLALVESDVGCLLLMQHSLWSKKVDGLLKNSTDAQKRFWLGLSDTPELDRSGRVLINSVLREGAQIKKEIVLLGVGDYLEIWDSFRLGEHKSAVRDIKLNTGDKL